MGFDKPDLGFVVHLGAPASPVAYYQQVGRAGRATERADVLLLPASEDREIWRYFATASMPRRADADAVLTALAESSPKPMSTAALETVANVRRTRLELLLKVLDVEGAVQRVSGGWASTGAGWTYDEERYSRVAAARDAEAASMLDYQGTDGCRMRFLQEALDDPGAADCGRCDRCAGAWYDATVPDGAVQAATRTLRKVGVPLEPRVPVAERHVAARGPAVRPHRPGRAARRGPRRRPAHRPRLGAAAARAAGGRRPGRSRRRPAAGGLRRGARRLGLGASDRSRSPPYRRRAGRSWWPRWPGTSPRSAG